MSDSRPWPSVPLRRLLACALLLLATVTAWAQRWTDADGRPNAAAAQAVALLASAADDGLDPLDYGADGLARRAQELRAAPEPAPHESASFEAALDAQLPRYLRHLHQGRVVPGALGFRVGAPRDEPDYAALIDQATAQLQFARTAASLAPALPAYRQLRDALARYRSLAAQSTIPTWTPVATLRPGDRHEAIPNLRRRLAALGDLPSSAPAPVDDTYDDDIVEAVRRFQSRHGLLQDGTLGPATQTELAVPVSQRVRQIELSMERLRWLPPLERPFLAVNIPMFRLWGVDVQDSAAVAMNVIVGRALNTRTPVLLAQMRQVVFRPYWNVPRSILLHELLPLIERDRGYLARHDMEIVRGAGDDAASVEPTTGNLALLRSGALRLRQRPGPRNSLGLVKFDFPNDSGVYLHGTPVQSLFARPRRDLSHGCVRVEDPVALAEWVLRDQPGWTRERIVAAMNGERSQAVPLARRRTVVLYYVSALAGRDGSVQFAQDVYGHDTRLERALAARRPH
jgi:murein L,D-transpeptidase YcbB/YkuD